MFPGSLGQQLHRLCSLCSLLAPPLHHRQERAEPGQNHPADAKGEGLGSAVPVDGPCPLRHSCCPVAASEDRWRVVEMSGCVIVGWSVVTRQSRTRFFFQISMFLWESVSRSISFSYDTVMICEQLCPRSLRCRAGAWATEGAGAAPPSPSAQRGPSSPSAQCSGGCSRSSDPGRDPVHGVSFLFCSESWFPWGRGVGGAAWGASQWFW